MEEQDVGQGRLAFIGVEGGEVDASIRKGLVGRSEDRVGSLALKGFSQLGLDQSSDQ